MSNGTSILPGALFLVKLHPLPVQLTHRKDPLVLRHVVLPLQLCFPVAHSSISATKEVVLNH